MSASIICRCVKLGFLTCLACLFVAQTGAQPSTRPEREEMYKHYLDFPSHVKGGKVEPHWMAEGSTFWYAEGSPANTVIWKVDPEANTKDPLFDAARLRKAIADALGHEPPYKILPFDTFAFTSEDETTVKFAVEGKEFLLNLDDYAVTAAPSSPESGNSRLEPQITRKGDNGHPDLYEVRSPDGKWFVGLHDHDLWLRSAYDGRRIQLTTNGVEDYEWGSLPWVFAPAWSPDSLKLAVKRHDFREVPKIPVVHYLNPVEDVQWVPYPFKAGMPTERHELYVIDILSKRQVKIEAGGAPYNEIWDVQWVPDGRLLFQENDIYRKRYRLATADPKKGTSHTILSESHLAPFASFPWISRTTVLDGGKRVLWRSNRDGWHHLYLHETESNQSRRLTEGEFPVFRVVTVDEKEGWVYFIAGTDRARPYDTHLCRIRLGGTKFRVLTEAPGQHDHDAQPVRFSPDKEFFLDTHSSPSRPPSVDLWRADGTFVRTLSKAHIDTPEDLTWIAPEEFVAKGADGTTDLYGLLYKPYDFEPADRYPVIQVLEGNAGAQRSRNFASQISSHALAQLGFIVFAVNTHSAWPRGIRGPEFEQLVHGNFGRHEIPDQVAALKNLGEKRPYMDLKRVGVMGGSFNGYFAVRSMLTAPESYHVAVAAAPVLDVNTHANYQWLGPPEENRETYEHASNYRLAGNLRGKLLLIQGTSDLLVPISQTMRMVDALVRADKPFDLMILPEWGHWGNERMERYWMDRAAEYFQEHLRP